MMTSRTTPPSERSNSSSSTGRNRESDGSFVQITDLAKPSNKVLWSDPHRPLLIHLNADTSWLVSLPLAELGAGTSESAAPANGAGRTRFNIRIDPCFQGPQSDVAAFFSTQWHVVPPSVVTIAELNRILSRIEKNSLTGSVEDEDSDDAASSSSSSSSSESRIDIVLVSHEFTDHCHKATLLELPPHTPVFAANVAADLVRGWGSFKTVITIPNLVPGQHWSTLTRLDSLPSFVGIGRATTAGNSLYYHSAIVIAFKICHNSKEEQADDKAGSDVRVLAKAPGEAIIYSPHGIESHDIASVQSSGLQTLALLHGLHDVRIWMMKQLNLGALNGVKAAAASRAKYWIATHDEVKKGGGIIGRLLRRKQYSIKDAVDHQQKQLEHESGNGLGYRFVELGSGDGIVLK